MSNFTKPSDYFPENNDLWNHMRNYYFRFDNDEEFRKEEQKLWKWYEAELNRCTKK